MKWEVEVVNVNTNLNVRNGPSTSNTVVGKMQNGNKAIAVEMQNGWYKLDNGNWVCGDYIKKVKDLEEDNSSPQVVDAAPPDSTPPLDSGYGDDFDVQAFQGGEVSIKENKYLNKIMGLPPQFMEITDFRNDKQWNGFGRLYAETLLADNCICLLSPGRPDFMSGMSKKAKQNAQAALASGGDSASDEDESGRYYTFAYQYEDYLSYVNTLCRYAAHKLGIADKKSPFKKKPYGELNWGEEIEDDQTGVHYMNSIIGTLMGRKMSIPFYVDYPGTSVSHSISNSTDKSKLDSLINAGSDMVREAEFVLGVAGAGNIIELNSQSYTEAVNSSVAKYTNGTYSGTGLLGRLGEATTTIFKGGQLIFPEIYRESQYSKNQSISIKLKSIYGDKESIYLSVMVPFFFLLAFALPRQLNPNATVSPFLIRAMAPGWFSCDMGLIESMSWEPPSDTNWSIDGLPLSLDVSISIRDMYASLATSPNKGVMSSINVGMLDFITTMCAANMNLPDLDKILLEMMQDWKNNFTDTGREIVGHFQEDVINAGAIKEIVDYFNKVK